MAKKDKGSVDITDESQVEKSQGDIDPSPDGKSVDITDESAKSFDDQIIEPTVSAVEIEKVIVTVPNAFRLTLQNGIVVQIKAGVQTVEKSIAEHFYSKANGMKIFNPDA